MRFTVPFLSLAAMLLTGCAFQGTIVQKLSRPHPLYHSIGIDGVYTFVLRDSGGVLHRQMVSPEVFEAYSEGQYFNDQQAGPSAGEFKQTQTAEVAPAVRAPSRTASHKVAASVHRSLPDAPPAVETTQSFRASEMEHSSRSMTATLRTEVPHDVPVASDEGQKLSTASVTKETVKPATHSAKKAADKKKSKKDGDVKSAKPWKMTEPTVEGSLRTEPAPPSEGPADNSVEATPPPLLK